MLSRKTKRAIDRYGIAICLEAHLLNSEQGEGPSTISAYLGFSGVGAANSAINAGREICESRLPHVIINRDGVGAEQ